MRTQHKTTPTATTTPSQPTQSENADEATEGLRSAGRVKVRMYRQGLGDCFLITLPLHSGGVYRIMIDCGVILGTPDAATIMNSVVQNIIDTTGGHIDLLIATHEHWDHLSGFVQAQKLFEKLSIDEVWVGWTEDPDDDLAKKLGGEHQAMRLGLSQLSIGMQLAGNTDGAREVAGLLEFFGATGSGTTGDALKFVKTLSKKKPLKFCRPTDAPVELPDAGARLYVLGPPHDEKMIKRFNPSSSAPETYGMAAVAPMLQALTLSSDQIDPDSPFDRVVAIPLEAARQMPFFQTRYWGEDPDASSVSLAPEKDQSWRRIDTDWLGGSQLALHLDSATNNTSLVLAIELADGEVLLFPADAQVGNWLSWQDLKWEFANRPAVTGPDLLNRTVFYKAGHHGSHNATLREKGLELMHNLQVAMIPVNHAMAVKKRWGNMPLPDLLERLDAKTANRVIRIDMDVPLALQGQVDTSDPLYYEIALPLEKGPSPA